MNVSLLAKQGLGWAQFGLKLAPWGVTFGMLGGWLVYPTLTEDFKGSIGLPVAQDPTAEIANKPNKKFKLTEISGIPEAE